MDNRATRGLSVNFVITQWSSSETESRQIEVTHMQLDSMVACFRIQRFTELLPLHAPLLSDFQDVTLSGSSWRPLADKHPSATLVV